MTSACPFLAADAALYADDDAVERIPALWADRSHDQERVEHDLGRWQYIGDIVPGLLDTFEAIVECTEHIEQYIDICAHRIMDGCIDGFGLSPSYDLKIAILRKVIPNLHDGFCQCGSPIERLMLLSLLVTFAAYTPDVEWREVDGFLDLGSVILGQQVQIGPYRVDFLLGSGGSMAKNGFVIECDGHDFHERTPIQAQRDKSRDRWLQAHGFMVFRFTGREIYKQSADCAAEIFDALALPGAAA